MLLLAAPAVRAEEALKFAFDGRPWSVGENRETSHESITEWVLPGERVTNWQELVTVQSFWGFQNRLSIDTYLQRTEVLVRRRCEGARFAVIRRAERDALYETSCPQPAASTLDRVVFGREAIHILQYAHKGAPLQPLRKATWQPLLDAATLAER